MLLDGKESVPGGYSIKELKIISQRGGEIDINYMIRQLVITESINAPVITGTITLYDALNIITNLPVMEGDKLKGNLSTYDQDQYARRFDPDGQIEFEYEIFKIGKTLKIPTKQDVQLVELHFCSPLWSDNLKGRVSQAFCQTPYTSAAKQIYDEYLKKGGMAKNIKTKELEIEQSDEMFNFIIPNWKPLEAITWLADRAWKDKSACYRFFENKEKFRLVTLTKLMKEGPKLKYCTHSQNRVLDAQLSGSKVQQRFDESLLEGRYRYLFNINIMSSQDMNNASNGYLLGRRMITHDIMFKRVKDYYFKGPEAENYKLDEPRDYTMDFNDMQPMNGAESLIDEKIAMSMGPKEGDEKLVVYPLHHHQWTGVEDNFKPEKWLRQHKSQMQHMEFYNIEATCPGNFTMKAGDVIDVEFYSPEASQTNEGKKEPIIDKRHSGKWLVTYVSRSFSMAYDSFYMQIRLARNDRKLEPNPIWNSAQEWKPGEK